jgi:tetratricopeptide (TPR) repeat protein
MASRHRRRQAVRLARTAAESSESLLGAEHEDTLVAREALARAYMAAGDYGEACRVLEAVLAIRVGQLGNEHYGVLRLKNLLGLALSDSGDLEAAKDVQLDVLRTCGATFGEDDEIMLAAMVNLAATLGELQLFDGLVELHERVIARQLRVHGERHIDTLQAMGRLAKAKFDMGDARGSQEINTIALARAQAMPTDLRTIVDAKRSLFLDAVVLSQWESALRLGDEIMADAANLPPTDGLRVQLTRQRKYIEKQRRKWVRLIEKGEYPAVTRSDLRRYGV